jgi:hypothetical protein
MSEKRNVRSKAEALALLRRSGVHEDTIRALEAVLPDPVDLERDANLLARYGITRSALVDRMGGSP